MPVFSTYNPVIADYGFRASVAPWERALNEGAQVISDADVQNYLAANPNTRYVNPTGGNDGRIYTQSWVPENPEDGTPGGMSTGWFYPWEVRDQAGKLVYTPDSEEWKAGYEQALASRAGVMKRWQEKAAAADQRQIDLRAQNQALGGLVESGVTFAPGALNDRSFTDAMWDARDNLPGFLRSRSGAEGQVRMPGDRTPFALKYDRLPPGVVQQNIIRPASYWDGQREVVRPAAPSPQGQPMPYNPADPLGEAAYYGGPLTPPSELDRPVPYRPAPGDDFSDTPWSNPGGWEPDPTPRDTLDMRWRRKQKMAPNTEYPVDDGFKPWTPRQSWEGGQGDRRLGPGNYSPIRGLSSSRPRTTMRSLSYSGYQPYGQRGGY